ncbi:amidase family protein [Motilibacter aurantiacus]|uniref:amidase family protein n=1 Tax=Motilibacter aurantiacus TaxID=2714955 RepID=UPI001408F9C5|nr:hypothetical protein [Motilibacter aurantiacus]
MRPSRRTSHAVLAAVASPLLLVAAVPGTAQAAPAPFVVEETTVADIHAAFADGSLTCQGLVLAYQQRIAAYEHAGPGINSLVTLAPDLMKQAKALDKQYRKAKGEVGPLHCIPVVLKDNIDTAGIQTTAGSKALLGSVPERDAAITAGLKADGALVLGKGNLDEWAHGGMAGYSSANGQTRNPYGRGLSPAGSSGGPAAAVAANFAVLSVGSDTLGSIRGPVSAESLAGVKPTMGLVSGAGVVPFSLTFDVAGPMTRAVTDSALTLNAIAGVDPEDPRTAAAAGKVPADYTSYLRADALHGKRIGVVRTYVTGASTAPINAALETMKGLGATIVDGITVPSSVTSLQGQYYTFISETEFKTQLGDYLRSRRPNAAVQSHADVLAASEQPGFGMAPSVLNRLRSEATRGTLQDADYLKAVAEGPAAMRAGIDALLDANGVDALVFATGSGSALASLSGYPEVMVPAGKNASGISVGLSFLGKAFTEPQMLGFAYAYEQATHARATDTILTPQLPAVSDLDAAVTELRTALGSGVATNLRNKLDLAQDAMADGDAAQAVRALSQFVEHAERRVDAGSLRAGLVADARTLIGQLQAAAALQ